MVNLPWYDLPELERETDALWAGIARHLRKEGIDAPDRLDRNTEYDAQWREPNLLFSQACGYDVLYDHAPHLTVIATPRYAARGCEGACYRSAIVVRQSEGAATVAALKGKRAAVNDATSHSGTNALRAHVAPHAHGGRFFSEVKISGAHTESLAMLVRNEADVACIDMVVWDLCERARPVALKGLRKLAETEKAPAPPFVTARNTPPEKLKRLRMALFNAMADASLASAREALLLDGVELLSPSAYQELWLFEDIAKQHGYFELPAPKTSPLSRQ
ncbi:MAG: PhnD/SsuA/transferrin family substrate-binding protein [Planctomycetes bacterium]|nr:PhnD/SsuA/transferrin family substrate-binding protein [Planctomycetota bacterium]